VKFALLMIGMSAALYEDLSVIVVAKLMLVNWRWKLQWNCKLLS